MTLGQAYISALYAEYEKCEYRNGAVLEEGRESYKEELDRLDQQSILPQ